MILQVTKRCIALTDGTSLPIRCAYLTMWGYLEGKSLFLFERISLEYRLRRCFSVQFLINTVQGKLSVLLQADRFITSARLLCSVSYHGTNKTYPTAVTARHLIMPVSTVAATFTAMCNYWVRLLGAMYKKDKVVLFLCGLVVRVPDYRSWGLRFDCRHYQIVWEVVSLELEWKDRGSGLQNRTDPLRWPRDTRISAKLGTKLTDNGSRSVNQYISLED
jgi:hypothetical protein